MNEGTVATRAADPSRTRRRQDAWITATLVVVAAAGWAWTVVTARGMGSSSAMAGSMGTMDMSTALTLGTFVLAWVAMMAAMMLPSVAPVVRIYASAAGRGLAAPLPVFVAGYLVVWSAIGLPAFVAWRALANPLANGARWAELLAGAVLVVAAAYQVSPLKRACLRHCRSPLGFFMGLRGNLRDPRVALRAGASHGLVCLGCCWALMAILVALGTMSIPLMVVIAAVIFAEKTLPHGERVATAAAVLIGGLGAAVLLVPEVAPHLS